MTQPLCIDLKTLRAAWVHLSGLTQPTKCKAWLHAIGGVDVFLASQVRTKGFTRTQLDRSVLRDAVRIVPGARGCTMLVPSKDVPLARQLGSMLCTKRTDKELAKLDVTSRELEALGRKVLKLLGSGGHEPSALRAALPKTAIRSLGDAGKKLGHTSTLPVTLRKLESQGRIRRKPVGGKLEAERYEWLLDEAETGTAKTPDALTTAIGRHYFSSMGPATLKDFATWAGLTQRDAKHALSSLKLQELAVAGLAEAYWMMPKQAEQVAHPPGAPRVLLLSFRDPLLDARASPLPLIDEQHWDVRLDSWNSVNKALRDVRSIHGRCILVDGAVAGLWDYDPDSGRGIWGSFAPARGTLRKEIAARVATAASFLHEEFGHALIYPMENAKSRDSRLSSVRGLHD